MKRHIIAYLIKGEAAEYHQNLVDMVSNSFELRKIKTPSHITLKDSFFYNDLVEVIDTIKSSTLPTGNVILNGIGNFDGKIFYIKSELNDDAKQVFNKLLLSLKKVEWMQWDTFDTVERDFHVTITNKANESNRLEIEKTLSSENPYYVLPFDNIAILTKDEESRSWYVAWEMSDSTL